MSDDIVTRLRVTSDMIMLGEKIRFALDTELMDEAADEITRLRGEVERLKAYYTAVMSEYGCDAFKHAVARAEAAEAKVAELAKEVAEWRSRPDALRADKSETKVAKLREALTPFAKVDFFSGSLPDSEHWTLMTTVGDLRRARAVLQETEQ